MIIKLGDAGWTVKAEQLGNGDWNVEARREGLLAQRFMLPPHTAQVDVFASCRITLDRVLEMGE